VNVNLKAGFTFANALRTFLRQDPDIIMIGEIRDLETAEIAIQAAQTGHLVLSTLHTNSAAETINRLIHMGVPQYQLATSLSLVIAQRLIRLLCTHCKVPSLLSQPDLIENDFSIYSPNPDPSQCKHCKLGYLGRTAIYECMPISIELQTLMLNNASVLELNHQALKGGMWHLRTSALHKVKLGLSSLAAKSRSMSSVDPHPLFKPDLLKSIEVLEALVMVSVAASACLNQRIRA
jgi:type IV pilus assembly protein PilB